MHPAQRTFPVVERDVRLRDRRLQAVILELMLTEGTGKVAARILAALDVNHKCASQLCLCENHLYLFPFTLGWSGTNLSCGFPVCPNLNTWSLKGGRGCAANPSYDPCLLTWKELCH